MTHPEVMSKVTQFYQNTSVNTAVTSNVMKINVFYEFLGYTTYAQQVSYSDEQFVSDLGMTFDLHTSFRKKTFGVVNMILRFLLLSSKQQNVIGMCLELSSFAFDVTV